MVELAGRLRTPSARIAARRGPVGARAPLALTAGLTVGGLAFANGGYFPVSWGWAGLALLAAAAVALAAPATVELDRLELLFLGGLAAFTAWVSLSLLWTGSVPSTVLEIERTVVYLAGAGAGILLLRRASVAALLAGLWGAIAVVSAYGVATRLFPERLGAFDPIAGYRLSEPVGYWNAFGILAALGTLLALGLAARSGPVVRCLAGASTVPLLLALYFTFSRGAWIAFFVGLAAAIALDRRRLQLVTTVLVVAPWPAAALWAASASPALTHAGVAVSAATRDGHGLAVIAIGLASAAGPAVLVLDWLETAVRVPQGLQRVYAAILLCLVAATLFAVSGRYGLPPTLARKAYNAFVAPPPAQTDLNNRLFSLSGSGRSEQWHTAWQQASAHPLLGGGAGTFDEYWFQHRRVPATVHDAHNLYLETAAELGVPGLLLLALALGVPAAAAWRARSSPLGPIAFGAYLAYLVHAAADWDWEMPAITLTALLCGLAVLAAGRRPRAPRVLRRRVRVAALGVTAALAAFAAIGLLGNRAVSASADAIRAGRLSGAASEARRATGLAPWSSEPWRRLGEAQVAAGDRKDAQASFRKAIAKDRGDWTLWFELADASRGAARRSALAQASRLDPLGPEIASLADRKP